ncbi:MAG: MFS transporter [Deferrisomatales bacterium]
MTDPGGAGGEALGARVVLRLCVPFGLGYFLSYLFRVVNAVLATDLAGDLGVGPADLGLLTAAYFLAFGSFQLPLGVLLDRYGPRRTEAALLLFAALGALVFARAQGLWALVVGRALIGLGVSACLMAAFKAFVQWFPPQRLPWVNGVQMAAGGLGAVTATAPVELALGFTDWRGVFAALAGVTALVAALVYLCVPDRAPARGGGGERLPAQIRGIAQVFTSRAFWRVAPWAVSSQATFLALQGLWAGPWLRDVAGLGRGEAAGILLAIACAMVAGFLSLGALASRLSRAGVGPLAVAAGGMAAFAGVQAGLLLWGAAYPAPLWVLFGVTGTSGILTYASLSQTFPAGLAGRVNTGLNLLVFVAAFVAQWGLGRIIEHWPRAPGGGYAPEGYAAGFGVLLGAQVVAAAWFAAPGARRGRRPGGRGTGPVASRGGRV